MNVGYSGKPLWQKLGIKPGMRWATINEPPDYEELLGAEDLASSRIAMTEGGLDLIHVFTVARSHFESELGVFRAAIKESGAIWISWPKKSSGVKSDLDENVIRDFALANGMVDVKVCAVSEVWSGLKLVIPLALRKTVG